MTKSIVDYTYAFLFASLGFNTHKDAENHRRHDGKLLSLDIEPLFKTDRNSYMATDWLEAFSTNFFQDHRFGTKPVWHTLHRKDSPKPAGSYNIALMYEGPTKVYLADRLCECCVVWNRTDGKPLQPIWTDGTRAVYAARSGSGAMYARVLRYQNGKPNRLDTYFYALEFTVLDRDPAKDDMLRVFCTKASISYSDNPDQPREPYAEDTNSVLQDMLAQSRRGFEKLCSPVDKETKHRNEYYYGNIPKWRADSDKRNQFMETDPSYYRKVKKMNWKEALDGVQEAWEMAAVIDAHNLDHEFWPAYPNYSGSMSKRVYTMLGRYECTPERRKQLMEMIDLFVAPINGGAWSYDD